MEAIPDLDTGFVVPCSAWDTLHYGVLARGLPKEHGVLACTRLRVPCAMCGTKICHAPTRILRNVLCSAVLTYAMLLQATRPTLSWTSCYPLRA
eukprot:3941238-Rhodomonas_salina.1